jgi:SAM-dependent methyltransferase
VRRGHFEALRPVCPVCRSGALTVASSIREEDDDLLEGILSCANQTCRREYPVIDGIPVLVAAIRAWLAANPLQVLQRDDLSPELESLIGDVLGSGSAFDTQRQHVGIYAHDHYRIGAAASVLDRALSAGGSGTALDIGCATGGTTFHLASRLQQLTLGVDLNFAMLRVASSALRKGRVSYARRSVGLVYEREELAFDAPVRELVDFWCCDAGVLPFADATFGVAASLNVLDCVHSPREALHELARVVQPGGTAILATPYDWSPNATPVEGWIGGHSQRGPHRGAAEPVLRALLAEEPLELVAEEESVPWRVRLHERSSVEYAVHLVVARKATMNDEG